MRALLADAVAVAVLGVYGTEICPYMEGLGVQACWGELGLAFLIAHGAWIAADRRWIARADLARRPRLVYGVTLARYVAVGLAMTLGNALFLGFPLGSGLKLVVGCVALGHFAGAELMLERQRAAIREVVERGEPTAFAVERPGSFATRVSVFALASVLLVFGVLGLVLARDAALAAEPGRIDALAGTLALELALIGAMAFVLVARLVWSFGQSVRVFFASETRVLERVGRGELDERVPVFSDDEFGVIAAHTNTMIDGLRERRKVREVLGKIVSPAVARSLLADDGVMLGGGRRDVTLLFSDIRDFTAWSEGTEPEVLVRDLNAYFTEMVAIVHREGGVVDKFIGDGMMAVFGLDDPDGADEHATRAARAMADACERLDAVVTRPIRIGVGVHRGEVVAGNVGSPDRLEFTVIGDTVNTAARVESLTRTLDATILITRTVHDALTEESRGTWRSRGAHPVKGRREPVEVFAPA